MKVGLYSISCSGTWFNDRPALTVEEFIDTAKKYGYDGVEIDLKRRQIGKLHVLADIKGKHIDGILYRGNGLIGIVSRGVVYRGICNGRLAVVGFIFICRVLTVAGYKHQRGQQTCTELQKDLIHKKPHYIINLYNYITLFLTLQGQFKHFTNGTHKNQKKSEKSDFFE